MVRRIAPVIFSILILASTSFHGAFALYCPPLADITPCRCDEDTLTVDCSSVMDGAQLFNIFQNHFQIRNLETLIIDGSPLNYIIDQTFAQVAFKNITIVNTGIEEFEGYFFSGSERTLNHLDLSNNAIGRFTFATKVYGKLETLNLSGNFITYLTTEELTEGFASLMELDLSRNGLSSIESRTFQYLENLQVLDLSDNELSSLQPVALYTPSQDFALLDLSNNYLNSVDIAAIGKAPGVIDASNNNIRTLDVANYAKLFDSMSAGGELAATLHLAGNPLVCDCQVAWIVASSNSAYQGIIEGAECTDVDGNLEDLSAEDFAECMHFI